MSKELPDEARAARGTVRPDRSRVELFPRLDRPTAVPRWLAGRARELFIERVEVHEARGQAVAGFEESLAHYCALAADIEQRRHTGARVSSADMSTVRAWAAQFHDTPASQVKRVGKVGISTSKFGRRGQRKPV